MPPADPAAPQVPENRTVRALRETTFHASRLEPDGEYGEMFEAADWAEAERICEERGWMLRGRAEGADGGNVGGGKSGSSVPRWQHVSDPYTSPPSC